MKVELRIQTCSLFYFNNHKKSIRIGINVVGDKNLNVKGHSKPCEKLVYGSF